MQLWGSSLRLQLMGIDTLSMLTFHLDGCHKSIAITQSAAVSFTQRPHHKLVEIIV